MTEIVNTAQAQAWNGYEGDHWAGHYDRYDAVNRGFNEPLLAAAKVGAGDRVLDMGCGNGQLTRLAARRAAVATGVDLSGPMLARARERAKAEGVENVSFEQGDIQVFAFPDAAFDVALSRFGIMFFADPVMAFGNVARALRPGGRMAFAAMTSLSGTDLGVVFDSLAPHLPTFEIGHGNGGPASFANPDHIRAVLDAAGFIEISCELVEFEGIWGSDAADAAEFLMGWGPVRHHRELAGFATDEGVRAALIEVLSPFTDTGAVRLRQAAWLVTAATPLP